MKRRRILLILIILVTLLILLLVGQEAYRYWKSGQSEPAPAPTPEVTLPPEEEKDPYVSPIDFTTLQSQNSDIYAWLKVEGTCVDDPIVQRTTDNSFYLRRNYLGKYSYYGCVFTENYNTLTFEDPITVVYGHNILEGEMFGDLIRYTDEEYFNAHDQMTVYLPTGEKNYTLVAAVPFDNRHLLYRTDHSDPETFQTLADELLSVEDPAAVIREGAEITSGDKLVILSTCYYNIKSKRFLVIFKEE